MSYTLKIDHQLKIVRYTHSGHINTKEEIGVAWQEFLSLKEFTELGYNLLSDYRGAKFNFPISDIEFISGFLYSIKHILNGKKQSLVLDDPKSTAKSFLFELEIYKIMDFQIKIFSTIEEAQNWLLNLN